MDNSPETQSIKSLIDGIESESIVLPEFQRDFVWDIGKTYDLFDSLTRDIFVGSVIYGVPSFEVTARELDIRPRKTQGVRRRPLKLKNYSREEVEKNVQVGNFRLVLDGQQRITSIYRALKGFDEVWFIAKRPDELSDDDFSKLSLENILFEYAGQEDFDRLSIKISDVYKIMEAGYFEQEIRENFFDSLDYLHNKTDEEKLKIFRRYLITTRKIQDSFKADKLLSYYLLNTSSEKFAIFFERSNSKGIQLKFIDILAAKLYSGFNLRRHVQDFESEYPEHNLNREIIVRAIAYIVSGAKDVDKSFILSELTYEHFNEYWEPISNGYRKVLDFLYENNFIISQAWMPYENMLIPLIMFLREIGEDFSQMSQRQLKFIKYWYWASIFAQRYTSATNETIIQDSCILTAIAKNRKITDKNFFFRLKSKVENPEEIYSFSKRPSSIYRGILNLINYQSKGLLDWKNTRKITLNSRLEAHHIFPRDYLNKKYKSDEVVLELVDSVINRTLIPKISNIKIGKKPPSEYMKLLLIENPDLENCLSSHLIPQGIISGFYDNEYLRFLEERAKQIFALIENHVINLREEIFSDFYQEPSIKSGIVFIYGSYYSKVYEASLNLQTGQVVFNGQAYDSVSSAASALKKNAIGKERSVNGWEFWKYVDEQGQEKSINDLRYLLKANNPQLSFDV